MRNQLELLSKEDMALLMGGGDVSVSKTITYPDGKKVMITVTIKDDGSTVEDRVVLNP